MGITEKDKTKRLHELRSYCSYYNQTKCSGSIYKDECDLNCDFGECVKSLLNTYVVLSNEQYDKLIDSKKKAKKEANRFKKKYLSLREESIEKPLNELLNFIRTETFHKGHELKKIERKIMTMLGLKESSQEEKCKYFRTVDYGYRTSYQCFAQKYAPEVECCGNPDKCFRTKEK